MGKVKINKDDLNNIHLRKDDFNELIGIIPKSYLHYGIPIIFLFVLIILIGSWFFNYPDIVNAKVEITVNNLPVTIISHSSGRIEKLFVNDNELVEKDKILAVIENTAEFSDVMSMKNFLNPFQEYFQNDDSIFLMTPNKSFKLGDIQSFYSSFL